MPATRLLVLDLVDLGEEVRGSRFIRSATGGMPKGLSATGISFSLRIGVPVPARRCRGRRSTGNGCRSASACFALPSRLYGAPR